MTCLEPFKLTTAVILTQNVSLLECVEVETA